MFLLQAFGRSFWLTAIGAFMAISVVGTAFTSTLSGPGTTNTASGVSSIGGYTISAVSYTLNGTTPTNIDAITFTIGTATNAPKVGGVKAQAASAGSWYNCTFTGTGPWSATCASTSPQLTVLAADQLTVVVTQ